MTTKTAVTPASTVLIEPLPIDYGTVDKDTLLPIASQESPDIAHIITEDDEPVDNMFSAKNQRLLVEPLYSAWTPPTGVASFLADANVGIFYAAKLPPLVPDAFISLGVQVAENWWEKRHRSYFVWEFGKPPDVVVEIVSNRKGGEDTQKVQLYAHIGVPYYIIYDPIHYLGKGVLRVYELRQNGYVTFHRMWLSRIGLGIALWHGNYEGKDDTWLRWCDQQGVVIPTGKELADYEWQQKERILLYAEQAVQEKEQERQRAERAVWEKEQERQRAERAVWEKEQERQRAERAVWEKEQERQRAERAMQRAERAMQEKEQALHEKSAQARTLAHNLLPLLTDEQISHATGLSLDEVQRLRG